jgi:hypothetical protein
MGMQPPTLRELHALPLEHPPRGLALVIGVTTAAILVAGTIALARAAPADRGAPRTPSAEVR